MNVLGEAGWLKAIKLEEYAPRKRHRPQALQGALFRYASVLHSIATAPRYRLALGRAARGRAPLATTRSVASCRSPHGVLPHGL